MFTTLGWTFWIAAMTSSSRDIRDRQPSTL
jgi:hypothetical protein